MPSALKSTTPTMAGRLAAGTPRRYARPVDTTALASHARLAPLAMTFGEHLAASVRGLPCAPPGR